MNEWGPAMWKVLHEKTYEYPSEQPTIKDKAAAIKYFKGVEQRIPCKRCRYNYKQYLLRNPVEYHVDSRKELVRWLVDLHNEINVENGKRVWSYKEVDGLYGKSSDTDLYIIIAEVVAIIIVLFARP